MLNSKKENQLQEEILALTKRLYKAESDAELHKRGNMQRVDELESLLKAREIKSFNDGQANAEDSVRNLRSELTKTVILLEESRRGHSELRQVHERELANRSTQYKLDVDSLEKSLASEKENHAADVAALTYQTKALEKIIDSYKSVIELVLNKKDGISLKEIERIVVREEKV